MKKYLLSSLFAVLIVVAGSVASATGDTDLEIEASPTDPSLSYLFVLHATEGRIQDGRLVLPTAYPHVLYFSDRPDRVVGHVATKTFLDGWGNGKDSFQQTPPNVVVAFQRDGVFVDMTLEVSDPQYSGDTVSFAIDAILESDVEVQQGQTLEFSYPSLFIDGGCWIFGC